MFKTRPTHFCVKTKETRPEINHKTKMHEMFKDKEKKNNLEEINKRNCNKMYE